MKNFKVYYDAEEDILFLDREGRESDVVELSPGVSLELDDSGNLIGIKVFKASIVFEDVIKPMEKRLRVA